MGIARYLVQEVLWRRPRSMADTPKRLDLVQHRLDRNISLLLHTCGHDRHGRGDTELWSLL